MTDIIVYPHLSPRVIEVVPVGLPEEAQSVSIQDLYNAIRGWEDEDKNMPFDLLVSGAGKEDLGGETLVGITITLQNAQVMFTGRTTPLEADGTCTTSDPLGITLHATGGDFINNGITPGCTVYNQTTGASAAVTEVTSGIELQHFQLSGGSSTEWTSTDTYDIYPNVQCTIAGGNMVAVDLNGDTISAIFESPNVQILQSSSSSGTLQELGAIQFASFNGGVTVDTASSYSGTDFPAGTAQEPVSNLQDAMLIAEERGFTAVYAIGDLTIDTGYDYTGTTFIGESMTKSEITISDAANVTNCEFYEATTIGTLDGNAKLRNCRILDLNFIHGVIEECMLGPGTIVLGGSAEAHFLDCWSGIAGTGTPVIDCGGSGQDLALRNYNGGIKLINKTGTDKVSIDINSGQIILDSTVGNGDIVLRGIGTLTNNSTGSANVVATDLFNNKLVSRAVWDEVRSEHTNSDSFGATSEWVSTVDGPAIATAVWNATRTLYADTGTFGAVAEWAGIGGGLTKEETAAAVWNAVATDYGTPGTMGWLQNLIQAGLISSPSIIPGD